MAISNSNISEREAARKAASLQRQKMQKFREAAGSTRTTSGVTPPAGKRATAASYNRRTVVQGPGRSHTKTENNLARGTSSKAGSLSKKEITDKSAGLFPENNSDFEREVAQELKRRRRNRRFISIVAALAVIVGLGYFGFYYFTADRTANMYEEATSLRNRGRGIPIINIRKTQDEEAPDILEEYSLLYTTHRNLIGWIKIEDTNVDYPVMQLNNEFYLDHNYKGDKDKNGAIFMDEACDVIKPSDNLILYGHHMKSGNMFGNLSKYASEEYGKAHSMIEFDSIYEKGKYQVMYVFQETLKDSADITFKYYQFIKANSADEFASNMRAMADMSMYDTGVTARFGDRLLTLSTCDSSATDGRFVVVAKKVS